MKTLLRRLGDLFSFEMLFVLFMFAGYCKADASLVAANRKLDLALAMVGLGVVVGSVMLLTQWQGPRFRGHTVVTPVFLSCKQRHS